MDIQIDIYFKRTMLAVERCTSSLINKYSKHPPISIDCERTRYPQDCKFLKLKHYLSSPFEKSII